ncbi:DUF4157 domain-containing protein [bacterium]|nr:DUF4157 domain-containing protein [bacterium]
MANQDFTPGDRASFEQDDADLTMHSGDRARLSLSAVNSADRFVNALSPWIRESLTGEQSPRTQGSLIRRLMQKRRGDSFTFNGTVGIMRRFQRIVNRSVVWQANVGSIDPNLFDRFSIEMTRRREIGANNIGELLKINRQEESLEMPLAGAPDSSRPAQEQQPSEPARQLTFEEIKQRIEAARNFRSQSPSGQPDFVEAMRKRTEAQAPTPPAQPTQSAPSPFPSAATSQQPPVPASGDQPNPAAMSPRLRRRMGRKVEYISMPKMDEESGDADGEPGLSTYLALAPPGFSEPGSLPRGFFDEPSDDVLVQRRVETPARRRFASIRTAATPTLTSQDPRRALAASPTRSAIRHRRPQQPRRPASIIARSMQHLAQSTSGSLLASRPQSLLSHIAGLPGSRRPTSHLDIQTANTVSLAPISPSLDPGNLSPINNRRERSNVDRVTFDDMPLARHRLPVAQAQPDLVDLQTQPLHRLPTVSVRRTASVPGTASRLRATPSARRTATASPSPRPTGAATPSTPPGSARLSLSRPASPPREDSPVAGRQVDRLVAQPLPSFAAAQPSADVLRRDSDAFSAPMAVADLPTIALPIALPIASPTLLQADQVLVRRSAMTPTSQLWQPSLLADSFGPLSAEDATPERRMAFSRTTLIRQGAATRPRLPASTDSGLAQSLPVLSAPDAAASPLASPRAASWMPLAYTVQRLLQTRVQQSVDGGADISADVTTPLRPQIDRSQTDRPQIDRTLSQRRPAPAVVMPPFTLQPPTKAKAPTVAQPSMTLLERIVRRDFAQSRATTLEDGVLRLPPTPSVAAPIAAQSNVAASRAPEVARTSAPSVSTMAGTRTPTPQPSTVRDALSTLGASEMEPAATFQAPFIQRTSLLSQTLRQLAYTTPPRQESSSPALVTSQQRQTRLQRSGASLRPPQPQSAQPRSVQPRSVQPRAGLQHDSVAISLQPGQLAHTSALFGGALRGAQQPLSAANLWRRSQTSAPTNVDAATLSVRRRSFEQQTALNVTPQTSQFGAPAATSLLSLVQGNMPPASALPEGPIGEGALATVSLAQVPIAQVPIGQPRATFTQIDLPLRQLTRLFAPGEQSMPVQPVQFAREDAPAVQRRISQLPRSPRPAPTRSLPPSSVQQLWETSTLSQSSTLPVARPSLQSKPTTGRPRVQPTSTSSIQRLSSADSNVDFAARPDMPPMVRRAIAPPAVVRPGNVVTGDSSAAPQLQPVASSLSGLGAPPALSSEPPLVEQILARDFGGLRERELGVTSSQSVTQRATHEGRLPSVVSVAEVQRFPVRYTQSPRTRREWTRQLRRDLMPSAPVTATAIHERQPANFAPSPTAIHRRYWSAPPVSAAWPEVWRESVTGDSVWLPLVQLHAGTTDVIARSQTNASETMPQAPFARFPWLRRIDAPAPEITPSADVVDAPRRNPTTAVLQRASTRTPFVQTMAAKPWTDRQSTARSSTILPASPPVLQTPNVLQRASGEERSDSSGDSNIVSSTATLPTLSQAMPLRRLQAAPVANALSVTQLDSSSPAAPSSPRLVPPVSSGVSSPVPSMSAFSSTLPSGLPSALPVVSTRRGVAASNSSPSIVEGVVRRSFADGRRRVLAAGPLNVSPRSASGVLIVDTERSDFIRRPQPGMLIPAGVSAQAANSAPQAVSTARSVTQIGTSAAVQRRLSASTSSPLPQTDVAVFTDVQGSASLVSSTQPNSLPPLVLRQLGVAASEDRPVSNAAPAVSSVASPASSPASSSAASPVASPVVSRGRRMSQTLLDLVDRPADLGGLPKDLGRAKTMPGQLRAGNVEATLSRSPVRLRAGEVARRTVTLAAARRKQSSVEPVSGIWRAALLRDAVPAAAMAESFLADDQPVLAATRADGGRRLNDGVLNRSTSAQLGLVLGTATDLFSPQAATRVEPLELALNRLLNRPLQGVEGSLPPSEQVLQRMEDGGWRFKRSVAPTSPPPEASARGLARLQSAAPKRPIPAAPRTLLERVLQRDFAGVRVQMASLGALGIEAATQGNTVYLPPSAARLDSPDALALLGHELTHVAARLPATVQRTPLDLPTGRPADLLPDLPLAAPSLTRQLSQRLVQMSLREEESTAEAVESTVRRAARGRSGAALRARPRAAAQLAQRTVDGRRFAPVSSLWHGDGTPLLPPESALPASTNPFLADAASTGDVLETMQAQGWRFKRSRPGAGGATRGVGGSADVQRAVDVAQSLSTRGGEMTLPVQPRSLLERVLQRDFSGVRMQVAGLEPLGVEAAARGNTVYLQRETAANLSAPQNLALLGHELTHVAAAGHAPVQRQAISPSTAATSDLATPLVQRSILPDLPSSRGSVAVEERTADQVEAGIQRMQRVQRAAASAPVSTSPTDLPLSPLPLRARQVNRAMGAPSSSSRTTLQSPIKSPLSLSAAPSAVQRTIAPDLVSRREDAPSVLTGVTQTSMPVAQRFHVPIQRRSSGEGAEGDSSPNGNTSTSVPMAPMGEKITITAPRLQRNPDEPTVTSSNDVEPDWDRLAEKILPLLRDRLLLERDRLGW